MPQTNRTASGVLGGLLGLVALSTVAGVLVTATVTPAIAVTGAAAKQAIDLFDSLPAYLEVNAPMEPWNIYAPSGEEGQYTKLATFYDQNREPLTFEELSPVVIDAILSSEDKLFYEHSGVNLGATAKALIDNLRGTSTRGASTISQQFVKNVKIQECEQELDPEMDGYLQAAQDCWWQYAVGSGNEGVQRKLQEMRWALQIEKDYSKNDILLGYLNVAHFGGQVYGIEAASKYYFGKSSRDLSIDEAAVLAGIVQEPNRFRIDNKSLAEGNDADNGFPATTERRNYVIRQMLLNGKITQEQYDEAIATPITPNITPVTPGCNLAGENGYFCRYVKAAVESHPALGATEEERKENLRLGGIDIYTTLDPRVQGAGLQAMAERAPAARDDMNFGAAAVTLESSTGRILAMVQNTTFDESAAAVDDPTKTSLVYAADRDHGGSSGFAVGSTYKLFTLIDWLEKGRSINEVIDGKRRVFTSYTCNGESRSNRDLIQNYGDGAGGPGFVGNITRFTASSLNTGYLAMATQLDICEINAVASRMGANYATGEPATTLISGSTKQENNAVLFDVLGSKNIAPLDMAAAYATVANQGVYCTPNAIDRIVGRDGEEIPLPEPDCKRVISPEVAATAASALSSVMTSGGTGTRANTGDGIPLIGKTGTNEGYSTMMITSSTATTTATWVGNVQMWKYGEDRWDWVSLTRKYHNGTQLSDLRYFINRDIQRAANAVYGGSRFPQPDRHLTRVVYTDLPEVVGQTIEEATKILTDAGFEVRVGDPVDSDLATNRVAAQDPAAGKVAGGTTVTISPSNGQGVSIPNVSGQAPSQAVSSLQSVGLSNATLGQCTVDSGMSSGSPGEATGTRPGVGTAVNKSTTVRVDYRAPSCP